MPKVVFGSRALEDLDAIADWIEFEAGAQVADAYIARIRAFCLKLSSFPNRGRERSDIAEGLRTLPFERRATILYRYSAGRVRIVRVYHHGRDLR